MKLSLTLYTVTIKDLQKNQKRGEEWKREENNNAIQKVADLVHQASKNNLLQKLHQKLKLQ